MFFICFSQWTRRDSCRGFHRRQPRDRLHRLRRIRSLVLRGIEPRRLGFTLSPHTRCDRQKMEVSWEVSPRKPMEKWRLKQPEPMGFGQSRSRHSWRAMMAEALVIDPFPLMLAITTFLENFVDKSYSKAQFTSPEMEKIIKVGGHNNQTQLDV